MLILKLTEASRFQNVINSQTIQILLKKKNIYLGRGQQLNQLKNQQNQIIDLNFFDATLSRIHACFKLSPAWLGKNNDKKPSYLFKFGSFWSSIDNNIIDLIWQFLRPKKICFIKDLKSKLGIFTKIKQCQISSEMIIEFVHSSFINILHRETYLSFQQFQFALNLAQEESDTPIILGYRQNVKKSYFQLQNQNEKLQILSFWRIRVKQKKYILLTENNLLLKIGRSSHCDIQIKDSAISRYQAHLKCMNFKWKIIDGNQIQKSKNGTWIKCKSINIPIYEQNQEPTCIKIGTIQCQIKLIQSLPWLYVSKIFNNEINTSNSFIRIGFQQNQEESKNYINNQNTQALNLERLQI